MEKLRFRFDDEQGAVILDGCASVLTLLSHQIDSLATARRGLLENLADVVKRGGGSNVAAQHGEVLMA